MYSNFYGIVLGYISTFLSFVTYFYIVLSLYRLMHSKENIGFGVCMTIFLFILICIPFGVFIAIYFSVMFWLCIVSIH